ncbi:MAG: GNAT family N-acetyltransferase [Eubacteriales bacterium]|nr:GNAT family N-acetyltransferase [Eubacteriales bacterium]MDD3883182.1 GNAT family N-acetyltransferase [Eubacteriales bacterium]MDD4513347.1 GNAT family N-acetyltransferase [Eubacteriales bacterium]
MEFEGLEFTKLERKDVPVLTPIMKRAFDADSKLFFQSPEGGPDGYDDGSFLIKWGIESGAHAFTIMKDGAAIGGIILFVSPDGKEGTLGCLFIDDMLEGKGFGSAAWRFAEKSFPDVEIWRTETPAVSYRNHCFYINKCGFSVTRVNGRRDDRFEAQFELVKRMK